MNQTLVQKSLLTTVVLALRLATQAATLVLLTRLFGPATYGHFAAAAALGAVLGTLPSLGSGYVLLRRSSGDINSAGYVWRYAWPLTFSLGLVLLVAYVSAGQWVADGQLGLCTLLLIGAAELLVTPFTMLASLSLQAADRVPLSQLVQWAPLGLRVLAAAFCFARPVEHRLSTYVTLQMAASLAGALIGWLITRRHVPLQWRPRWVTTSELKDGSSYAAMLLIAANPTELDKIAAVRQVGATDAGIYVAGSRMMGALVMPVLAMLLAAQPRLFRHARESDPGAPRLIRTLFALALGWGMASGALLAIASPWLPWIFGAAFSRTAQLVPWMALSAPLLALRLCAGSVLIALGHPLERAAFELCGIVLLVVGMLVLTPWLGVYGLVAAVICSEAAMCAIGIGLVAKHARSPYSVPRTKA